MNSSKEHLIVYKLDLINVDNCYFRFKLSENLFKMFVSYKRCVEKSFEVYLLPHSFLLIAG